MMQRSWRAAGSVLAVLLGLETTGVLARQIEQGCGTRANGSREEVFLHQRHVESRRQMRPAAGRGAAAAASDRTASEKTATRDAGNIALMDDQGGTVGRRNVFNLDQHTITFRPVAANAAKYTFEVSGDSYESAPVDAGVALPLNDDDSAVVNLPYAVPFFGAAYTRLYVNSDGNITFRAGDSAISDRGFGRFTSGPPRIAALFTDLNPSLTATPHGVVVTVETARVVVTWSSVPLYASSGGGAQQTFQVRIYKEGRIEIAFHGTSSADGVTGISPGALDTSASLVSFLAGSTAEFAGAVGERFSSSGGIDIVTVAQRFYETHEDAYDYLVIYNTLNISPAVGAVAQETTVRNDRSGYGDTLVADGPLYGSARRLQAVMNMGHTAQYPLDPFAPVPARGTVGDTPLSVLGHEAGHLFLAFVTVNDPVDPAATPMLGRSNVHWSFFFNSEASLLEGNRLTDYSPSRPQFASTGTVQAYSPLDQYLMGFRTPEEVPDTFYVADPDIGYPARPPQFGVTFNGARRPVRMQDVIAVAGRRTPDSTVAQRHFRFAFVLVYGKGSEPTAAQIAQIEKYRAQFPAYFTGASSNRATAETSLRRAVQFSGRPAMGVVQDRPARAVLSLQQPADKDVVFVLKTPSGIINAPANVTIPAGQSEVVFDIAAVKPGIEEMLAEPSDARYEIVHARVNGVQFGFFLKPAVVSGDKQTNSSPFSLPQPVVFRASDINGIPYPGVKITAAPSTGGSVEPAEAVADENGLVAFRWTPSPGPGNQLTASIGGVPGADIVVTALSQPVVSDGAVLNAASFTPVIAPSTFAAVFGASLAAGVSAVAPPPFPNTLAGVQVLVDKIPAPVVSVSDRQINFVIPADATVGYIDVSVMTPLGASPATRVHLSAAAPAVFAGENNLAAALIAGTGKTTADQPAIAGDFLEIYATGLNGATPEVTIGGVDALVTYGGASTLGIGFDQINVRVPDGVPSGDQPLVVKAGGVASVPVTLKIQ